MYSSNNYKLECESVSSLKKFEVLHNISLSMKIIALLCIVAMVWKLWFLIASVVIFVSSIILSSRAFFMVFTYEYYLDNGILKVTKYYKNNTSKVLITMAVDSDFECAIIPYDDIDFDDAACYIDRAFKGELYLKISLADKQFYIIADKYFYSLLMENK